MRLIERVDQRSRIDICQVLDSESDRESRIDTTGAIPSVHCAFVLYSDGVAFRTVSKMSVWSYTMSYIKKNSSLKYLYYFLFSL